MRVWDLPLRLFHWGLLLSVSGAIISAKVGVLWVHERFGLTVLGLVMFRILWGFIGGHYARFNQFLAKPQKAFQELKNLFGSMPKTGSKTNRRTEVGHSALGSYAVICLLGIPLLMAVSGTMSNDGVLFDGPLAHLVPNGSDRATTAHQIGEKLLFTILFMHVSAILIYKFKKKRNLTKAMVTGNLDDAPTTAVEGGVSINRTCLGILLMLFFIALAQSITLLRPDLF